MRILMSLPDKRVRGGPPSHLYLLRETLADGGVDVRSFIFGGRTHDESLPRKVLQRLVDLARVPFLIARHRPRVVHLNSAYDEMAVLRDVFFVPLTRLLGQRVVLKFHGSSLDLLANEKWFWRLATRLIVRSSHVVCLLSGEEAAAFRKRFPGSRFTVVKNALDLDRYQAAYDFRGRFGIPPNKKLLLFIARFLSTKGLREVIDALPIIRQHHDVHTVFVGDGPARADNEAHCESLGLQQDTTFTGFIPEEDTVAAYLASDMLVFPTYYREGMPMVIFHSLACGLPIVTTKIRAAADWLEEGKHCLFVPPRDASKVAEAVIQLLDRPTLSEAMGRHGKELARKFEKSVVAQEWVSLYESMVDNGRS